ncbi:MAG: methyltransferase domain-containing protein [Actinomycetota bacterium]
MIRCRIRGHSSSSIWEPAIPPLGQIAGLKNDTSRSVLEHLDDVEAFVAEANRVLFPGGYTVHLFVGRFACW